MKKCFLIASALTLAACGDAPPEGALAQDEGESRGVTLDEALYVAPPGARAPAHDWVPQMSIGIDTKRPVGRTPPNSVRFQFDYPGSPSRVSGACLGTFKITGKDLKFECSDPSELNFVIKEKRADGLTLANEDGETFVLDRVDPDRPGDVRVSCETEAFKLKLDLSRREPGHRVLLRVTPKDGQFQGQSPQGIFVLSSDGRGETVTFKGRDLYDNDVKIALPVAPTGAFRSALEFSSYGPFMSSPKTHALACKLAQ